MNALRTAHLLNLCVGPLGHQRRGCDQKTKLPTWRIMPSDARDEPNAEKSKGQGAANLVIHLVHPDFFLASPAVIDTRLVWATRPFLCFARSKRMCGVGAIGGHGCRPLE
jgi:hypothetical protein